MTQTETVLVQPAPKAGTSSLFAYSLLAFALAVTTVIVLSGYFFIGALRSLTKIPELVRTKISAMPRPVLNSTGIITQSTLLATKKFESVMFWVGLAAKYVVICAFFMALGTGLGVASTPAARSVRITGNFFTHVFILSLLYIFG